MATPNSIDAPTKLVEAINNGALETIVDLFEADATFVAQPGMVAKGSDKIREAFKGLLSLKPKLTSVSNHIIESGDIATYYSNWTLQGTDPAGNNIDKHGKSVVIIRKQNDGNWLVAIDNPSGTDLLS